MPALVPPGPEAVQRYQALDLNAFLGDPGRTAALTRQQARDLLVKLNHLQARFAVLEKALAVRLAEPDPAAEPDRVLTVAEAAQWLGRKESYVAELKTWAKANEDPGIRK
jgi:hypothetical protein